VIAGSETVLEGKERLCETALAELSFSLREIA
jgi:hypothetical protein